MATRKKSYVRSGGYGEYYIDGNTARRLDVREEIKKAPRQIENQAVLRNRAKARHMNLPYVLFLAVAVCLAASVLIGYIKLQAENTKILKSISAKESQLNTMRLANDEEYSRIVSSVDLAYVKDVALNELGMQYAEEGQIVNVEIQGDDYVRQYQEMP